MSNHNRVSAELQAVGVWREILASAPAVILSAAKNLRYFASRPRSFAALRMTGLPLRSAKKLATLAVGGGAQALFYGRLPAADPL
jgi:hypothetical protein